MKSRIIMQERRVSMLLEQREIKHQCDKHAEVLIKQVRLSGSDWGKPHCDQCRAEKEESERIAAQECAQNRRKDEERRRIEEIYRRSGIPPRFAERTFAEYRADTPEALANLEQCRQYAEDFPKRCSAGQGIIMSGTTGTGKTHLAAAIANHVMREHGKEALYTTVGAAFRLVKDTYRHDSGKSETDALAFFSAPALLILDEIGVQYGSDTEKNILFDIVNDRYERLKPTIIISNLGLNDLRQYAGDRVLDRMREGGGMVMVFNWKSHRVMVR